MPDHITRIRSVKAVTLTKAAMNPEARVLLLKSKTGRTSPTPANPTGESDMDAKLLKSFAGFDDDTRAYVAGLDDDKVQAFMEQTPEARTAEVKKSVDAAKAAKDAADAEAERVKALEKGDTPAMAEFRKEVRGSIDEIKGLVKGLTTSVQPVAEAHSKSVFKSRAQAEFPNVPTAATVLESISHLSADDQKPTIELLKSQNAGAGRMTGGGASGYGGEPATEGTKAAELEALVKSKLKAQPTKDRFEILGEINSDPEYAELVNAVRLEESQQ